MSVKSCLLDYSRSHLFNGLSFCFYFKLCSVPVSGLMVMFAVVHYHGEKREKRGTHQRAFFPPFFSAKVFQTSERWGRRAGRKEEKWNKEGFGRPSPMWPHVDGSVTGALSYHVTTSCLTRVFIEEANSPSSPPYVISSHERCDVQKHTTTVILSGLSSPCSCFCNGVCANVTTAVVYTL